MFACDAFDAIAASAAWSLSFCECAMSGGMFVNCYLPLVPVCMAEQPAMSAGRVERASVLSSCWLCGTQDSMETMKPMGSNNMPEPVLRCIVERYCNNMVPLICCVCDVFIATAVKNAAESFASDIGQKLLRCAEAFASRDDLGEPIDSFGHWHQSVAMQRTCRWEPWSSTSAQATATAVAKFDGHPQKQVRRIFEKYRLVLPDDKSKRSRVVQPRTHKIRTEHNDSPEKILNQLAAKHHITAYKRPFYLMMAMNLLPLEWVDQAELLLRKSWSTSWGGGKILNALLFNGERIVPESGNDMRGQAGNGCYYHHCKANQLYACILQQSDFGEALLSIGGERVPDHLQRPIVDLQRFCYKLGELRKVNQSRRCVYFRTFITADMRRRWLQRQRDSGNIVVPALW